MDSPANTMPYIDSPTSIQLTPTHPQSLTDVTCVSDMDLITDGGYCSTSPSQLVYPPSSLQTTPNTPTTIPNIILTGNNLFPNFNFFIYSATLIFLQTSNSYKYLDLNFVHTVGS